MKKTGFSLLLIILFLLLLLFPEAVKSGASEGLYLWYHSIVPILFPFLILSGWMVSYQSFFWILKPFFLISRIFPGLNPWYFYALILGFFCGYPMGAKAVTDLIETEKISPTEGTLLLPIVNQANPMFLAGYLSIHILENRLPLSSIFFFIYGIPVCGFFIMTAVNQFFPFSKNEKKEGMSFSFKNQKNSMSQSIEHTIWNSFSIIVNIGAYMMLFTIVTKLGLILFPDSRLCSILLCILEFSTGLGRLKGFSFLPSPLKISLACSLTSFGGLCTAAQTAAVIRETGISMGSYLLQKTLYALLVFLFVYSSSS